MLIEKRIINLSRSVLKIQINHNREVLSGITRKEQFCKDILRGRVEVVAVSTLIPRNKMIRDSQETSEFYRRELQELYTDREVVNYLITGVESILEALSRDGLKNVTTALPYLIIANISRTAGTQYLFMTGIKTNGDRKELSSIDNKIERELSTLEVKMAQLIDDDYVVSLDNLEKFIKLYFQYVDTFYKKTKVIPANGSDKDIVKEFIVANMALYILFRNTGIVLDEVGYQEYYWAIVNCALATKLPIEEAIVEVTKAVMLTSPFKEKGEMLSMSERQSPVIIEESEAEAYLEYMENGVVTYECDLEEFEKLLAESSLDSDRQNEYLAQMRNLINRRVVFERETIKRKTLATLMNSQDMELFRKAKSCPEAKSIVDDIETIIELMCEDIDDESREEFIAELEELMNGLRCMFVLNFS